MSVIKKIKLQNFKRFKSFSIFPDEKINLLIGDNESGKSTILSAIDIVLSGSRTKVENIGLDSLINIEIVDGFFQSNRRIANLPTLFVEVYLDEQDNFELNGKFNSDQKTCDGLCFICEPDLEFSKEISEIISQEEPNFPYEFYSISFKTFSGASYTGYRKFLRHVLIDNSQINNEYATRDYVRTIYENNTNNSEKYLHQNEYRKSKDVFRKEILFELNSRVQNYEFTLRSNSKSNLDNDLTISEDDINIENKGKGRQCFIKTDFALKKKIKSKNLDIVLIEEPENHLSHINMKKLIRKICESEDRQLFISTHSDLISSRLDLRKSILLNSNSTELIILKNLPEKTAKFFIKSPTNNILEFILSKKVILVEGDAEYILFEELYKRITKENLEESDVHIISVGGTSFKRYLDIAKVLKIKTAVIRDNDGNFQQNCIDRYSNYSDERIKIFFDENDQNRTFEISIYQNNKKICDDLFASERISLSVQDYMLANKTDAAYELLDKFSNEFIPPNYITEAVEWIRK